MISLGVIFEALLLALILTKLIEGSKSLLMELNFPLVLQDRLKKLEAKEVPPAAEEEPVQQPTSPPEPEKLTQTTSEPLTLAQVAAAHATSETSDAAPLPAAVSAKAFTAWLCII